jgi:hypothetical protein
MTVLLLVLVVAVVAASVVATFRALRLDGYRRVPTDASRTLER